MRSRDAFPLIGLTLLLALLAAQLRAQVITRAQLGTGVDENHEIVGAGNEFPRTAGQIYCVWKAQDVPSGTPVRGVWYAEDVGGAFPRNHKLQEKTLDLETVGQGYFFLSRPRRGWPPGKYRLEIYLGAELARTLRFTIK